MKLPVTGYQKTCLVAGILAFLSLGSLPAATQDQMSRLWSKHYQVFAFNDLGMHCYDSDFSAFAILPPFNVLHAQVIYKGLKPRLLSNASARLFYSAGYSTIFDQNANPVDFWSRNTTSIGKTNFWQYVAQLFPSLSPPPEDVGLLGAKMPSAANGPQPLNSFDPNYRWFSATGIPITNLDDRGKVNCFPVMRIQAYERRRNDRLASLDIVVPVSNEFNCASCHATGMDAAPPPRLPNPPTFSSRSDDDPLQFRENILILHDAMNATTLMDDYRAGKPALCASCHYSKALDLAGSGPQGTQAGHEYLSHGIHKHHGTVYTFPDGSGVIPIPEQGVTTCYYCHPGNETQCLRSVMATNGMECQSCHGGLLALGGVTPLLAVQGASLPADLTVKLRTTGERRQPWADLPKCQSCHTGNVFNHQGPEIIGRQAYASDDPAASPILAPASPFKENQSLYRFSQTHGGVACESCHGSTHAEWPARINSNDNRTPIQIQGYPAEITECTVCHGQGLPPSLKGPHGLHNVNDRAWLAVHGVFKWKDPASCQACHGLDWRGTVLSKAKADRMLRSRHKNMAFAKGTPISCYACHERIR